ncbi:MAG TPA: hypothetical protein VFX70_11650 [Mycobacteriales bacterium]|nr:hypothetical protein [Mycobacteriales bacterium]
MSTAEHIEACVRFAEALSRAHQVLPLSVDNRVRRCACGRAAALCEINSAARDAGLFDPFDPVSHSGLGG